MKEQEIVYICAQPDTTYFHWQVEVMIINFLEVGINPEQINVLFAYRDFNVSEGVKNLIKKFPKVGIHYYKNEVKDNKGYIPSIRPHIIAKHYTRFPELNNKIIFYHDCDIIFRKKIDFSLLDDSNCYLSDTNSYINADYISEKSTHHLSKMSEITNVDFKLAIENNKNSGGAQYLINKVDSEFWRKVEKDSVNLYEYFFKYEIEERNKLSTEQIKDYNPIQKWCADMWGVLWNLWFYGKNTIVHNELDFCWPNDSIEKYNNCKIFHNAGVDSNSIGVFYKSKYQARHPFNDDFSNIKTDISTIKYVEAILKVKNINYV